MKHSNNIRGLMLINKLLLKTITKLIYIITGHDILMVLSSYSKETPSKDKLSYLQNRLTKRMQFKSANNFF